MRARSFARRMGAQVGLVVLVSVIAMGTWIAVLEIFHVSPLLGARPWDVVAYFTSGPDAVERGAETLRHLGTTVADTGIGYVVGLTLSFLAACLFTLFSRVERAALPVLLGLRVLPLVILAPVITLIFGTGPVGVAVTVTIVVFFPCLAIITLGLRSTGRELIDVVRVNGGGRFAVLWHVRVPSSASALLAAARITLPAAVTGATIAEWLATGQGLGGAMARAAGAFQYRTVWADAVVLTACTLLGYLVLVALESVVSSRVPQSVEQ